METSILPAIDIASNVMAWRVPRKRILLLYKAYPFALASYFRHALEKRPDVELVTCGEYYGDQIPWNGGMRLPTRYVKTVDLPLPPGIAQPSWEMVKNKVGDEFDLVLNVDAGFHLKDKPNVPYALVATDPHVLGEWYKKILPNVDYFFNMQGEPEYQLGGDIYLPYACSPDHHYAMSDVNKVYDACLIGLHYEQRDRLVRALRGEGLSVYYEIGQIYDEYRIANNQSFVGLNWSSLKDVNARTFEIMAMMLVPVINRLAPLAGLGFDENHHYLGFDTVEEGVAQVKWALEKPEHAYAIARSAHNFVHERHTYEHRVQQIFDAVGM